ncbi:FecR domain-containing protein [Ottowia thiooxydans]|uniref:FecR domain-containing protein n=1 Tax=Ottowia thiooxydans TaxID=219182 RepID=UPI00041E0393|nr:FecR domain-containing protein [Ottowia thiooxydans]
MQQALEWQVTFWSGEVTAAERENFERWVAQDSEHARAWGQIQRTDAKLQSLSSPGAGTAIRVANSVTVSSSRRSALRVIVVVAGAGFGAYALRQGPQWQLIMADYRTSHGERREINLPDGSRLILNTATAIDVQFGPEGRNVFLRAGEIFVATAPDPQALNGLTSRPFTVHTAQGAVRAIGTRFTVRQLQEKSQAMVEDGAVEIRPQAEASNATRLNAGQRALFSSGTVEISTASAATETAWTRGLLVADRMRMEDFLAELGHYRAGVLRCDPAVRNLIVSGVYPLDDTELALSTLAQALPVRVDRVTRYWVTVRPRMDN